MPTTEMHERVERTAPIIADFYRFRCDIVFSVDLSTVRHVKCYRALCCSSAQAFLQLRKAAGAWGAVLSRKRSCLVQACPKHW